MGSKYPCGDHSFILGNRIHRSDNLFSFDKPISIYRLLATWFASDASITFDQGQFSNAAWGLPVTLTSFAASMAVNTLVTGLIVFKIFKVFLEVKAATVERTLGSLTSTAGGTKLRNIIFVIIESGMTLFAVQLIRVVFVNLPVESAPNTLNLIMGINQMFNVSTIRSVHF